METLNFVVVRDNQIRKGEFRLPASGEKQGVLHLASKLDDDNDGPIMVRSRFPGEVTEIGTTKDGKKDRSLRLGDKVKKGQLLAVIASAGPPISTERRARFSGEGPFLSSFHFSPINPTTSAGLY